LGEADLHGRRRLYVTTTRDGYREFARPLVEAGVFVRGMGHLTVVAVEFLQAGGSVDVLVGLPDHVLVKVDKARGAKSPEHGEEDFLKERILDHTYIP
jgi:hypothetical protein